MVNGILPIFTNMSPLQFFIDLEQSSQKTRTSARGKLMNIFNQLYLNSQAWYVSIPWRNGSLSEFKRNITKFECYFPRARTSQYETSWLSWVCSAQLPTFRCMNIYKTLQLEAERFFNAYIIGKMFHPEAHRFTLKIFYD